MVQQKATNDSNAGDSSSSAKTPKELKTLAKQFDVPYNTLRDNFLK